MSDDMWEPLPLTFSGLTVTGRGEYKLDGDYVHLRGAFTMAITAECGVEANRADGEPLSPTLREYMRLAFGGGECK
jgi:hypothetical protein